MTTVRIVTANGMRTAELVEQAGDWAITSTGADFSPTITHLPTGFAVPNVFCRGRGDLRPLLLALSELPRADLQGLDIKAIRDLSKKHGVAW